MSIDFEKQAMELITSMRAIYDEAHADGVMNTLLALTERLPSTCMRQWAYVFRELGKVHSDLNRFDILLGIYLALPFVEAGEWLSVWMKALPAANIHPISLMLCAGPDEDAYKQQIEKVLQAMNGRHRWFEGWQEKRDRKYGFDPHWILKLQAGKAVNNVLSSRIVEVTDALGHDKLLVGDGWCVHALKCVTNGHWYGCRIGRNLTAIGALDLGRCIGPTSVGRNLRVGGYFQRQENLKSCRAMPMTWDPPRQLGVRLRGKDFHIYYLEGHKILSQHRSPLEIPDSCIRLLCQLPECAWMQPEPV